MTHSKEVDERKSSRRVRRFGEVEVEIKESVGVGQMERRRRRRSLGREERRRVSGIRRGLRDGKKTKKRVS